MTDPPFLSLALCSVVQSTVEEDLRGWRGPTRHPLSNSGGGQVKMVFLRGGILILSRRRGGNNTCARIACCICIKSTPSQRLSPPDPLNEILFKSRNPLEEIMYPPLV